MYCSVREDKPRGRIRNLKPSPHITQAACEMLSTAGGKVAKSDSEKMKRKLEDVMKQLQMLEKEKSLSSRIRFVIKDVVVSFVNAISQICTQAFLCMHTSRKYCGYASPLLQSMLL
jgi:hypothetical protein